MTGLICGILLSWAALCASSPSFLARRQAFAGGCDQATIMTSQQSCYGSLMNVSQMQPPSGDNVFDNIEESCRDVAVANSCFKDEMRKCGEGGEILATMMANTFDYVCGEGLEIMLSESDCWAHEDFTSDILGCSEIMEAEFARMGYNGFCSVTNDFIRCIGDRIKSKTVCSEDAAWFMQELFRRSIRPAADMMGCHLHTRAIRAIVDVLRRK
ncbi:uncharacterized protein LOC124259273 [Haliotis rubra]|uniref:uncharacterized protein LOC124259273 n=1 Tax=Haliotis rubra TaxID=36100 RepID=UPI001EE603BA|nr:uncharacterized protein LOC124259273 [Haliotis rubra]